MNTAAAMKAIACPTAGNWLVTAIKSAKAAVTGTPKTKLRPGVCSNRVWTRFVTLGISKFTATNSAGRLNKIPIRINVTVYTSAMIITFLYDYDPSGLATWAGKHLSGDWPDGAFHYYQIIQMGLPKVAVGL
jgi:hypothetical protein